jgi:hypothetical protein
MMNRTEDPLTEPLGALLRSDEAILRHFLRFLFRREEEAAAWSRLPLHVETQHSFSDGRIDLLLHADSDGIIVECKVAERPKIYQIDRYHAYWLRTRGTAPAIFWLARKTASPDMGRNEHLTSELFWDDLRSMLVSVRSAITTPTTLERLDTFCRQMEANGALLRLGEASQWQVRSRGYDVRSTETFSDGVAAHLGREFDCLLISSAGNADHRLRVGCRAWIANFIQGNYLRWRDVLSTRIMLNRAGNIFCRNRRNANSHGKLEQLSERSPRGLGGRTGVIGSSDRRQQRETPRTILEGSAERNRYGPRDS